MASVKTTVFHFPPRGVYFGLGVFAVALLRAMGHIMLIGASVGNAYVPLVRAALRLG